MAKSFSVLKAKMSSDAQRAVQEKVHAMMQEMPLAELRHARQLSQQDLADKLKVKQAAISKLERRADMYISSLRDVIQAMGGELEIKAKFPDGDVKITQFESIECANPA